MKKQMAKGFDAAGGAVASGGAALDKRADAYAEGPDPTAQRQANMRARAESAIGHAADEDAKGTFASKMNAAGYRSKAAGYNSAAATLASANKGAAKGAKAAAKAGTDGAQAALQLKDLTGRDLEDMAAKQGFIHGRVRWLGDSWCGNLWLYMAANHTLLSTCCANRHNPVTGTKRFLIFTCLFCASYGFCLFFHMALPTWTAWEVGLLASLCTLIWSKLLDTAAYCTPFQPGGCCHIPNGFCDAVSRCCICIGNLWIFLSFLGGVAILIVGVHTWDVRREAARASGNVTVTDDAEAMPSPSTQTSVSIIGSALLAQLLSWGEDLAFGLLWFQLGMMMEAKMDPKTGLPKKSAAVPWPGRPSKQYLFESVCPAASEEMTAEEEAAIAEEYGQQQQPHPQGGEMKRGDDIEMTQNMASSRHNSLMPAQPSTTMEKDRTGTSTV